MVGLFAGSDVLYSQTENIIIWAKGIIAEAPLLGLAVFVLLATCSAMVAFFSSAVLAPVAIYTWGAPLAAAIFWLGWFLGGITSFCIGRFLGRSAAVALVGEEKISNWERQLSRRSRFIHILLFQAAVPSEIPGYVLGVLRYRFHFYVIALAITEVPYAIATVYLGDSYLKGKSTLFILLGVGLIGVGFFLLRFIRTTWLLGESR